MISLQEARALALASIRVAPPIEVPLLAAHLRYLASPMRASRPVPNLDNSAMDGYALRSAETVGANRDRPVRLKCVETIYAGTSPERTIGDRQAARLFTGAPIPNGADCVVRQEAARPDGSDVLVFVESAPGQNIRHRGEEMALGEIVLPAGEKLDAASLGLLAAAGMGAVPIWAQPRVSLLTVGDELARPGAPALAHQVYDCNGVLLEALCAEAGACVVNRRRSADREESIRDSLQNLVAGADLLITSGGASVGDRDLVKRCLAQLGAAMVFDGVALKPGKPASVAVWSGCPVVVLPGNPGAASVAFDQLARPMLLKRQGVIEHRQTIEVQLDAAQHKQGGLTYLLSAVVAERGKDRWATLRAQGSGQLRQNIGADGWAILPPGRADFEAGDRVAVELFAKPSYTLADAEALPGALASSERA